MYVETVQIIRTYIYHADVAVVVTIFHHNNHSMSKHGTSFIPKASRNN